MSSQLEEESYNFIEEKQSEGYTAEEIAEIGLIIWENASQGAVIIINEEDWPDETQDTYGPTGEGH